MVNRILILLFLSSLTAACGFDNSHAAAPSTAVPYRLQPGELVLAASPEDIPPIQAAEEYFVPAQKADLTSEDLIVGIFIGGESKAYPVRLLSLHEVVNDNIGDLNFAVTWCPLCYSPVVYQRDVRGQELTFRASGFLLNDNLVLEDLQTKTLWSQLLGQGIRGALRGENLEVLPSSLTTWQAWSETYPESLVMDRAALGYEGEFPDPYRGYFSSPSSGLSGLGEVDTRLPGKSLVYGVSVGNEAAALSRDFLSSQGLIQFEIGDLPLLAVFDPLSESAFVYLRENKGEVLHFQAADESGTFRDQETGTIWSVRTGAGLTGSRTGEILTPLPSQLAFWFAWSAFFPDTELVPSP